MTASRVVAVVGDPGDLCATYLGWHAKQRGFEVVELREDAFGVDWAPRFRDPPGTDGKLALDLPFERLAGTIVRFCPKPEVPGALELSEAEKATFIAERRGALRALANRLPGVVVNRTNAGRPNGSKPLQMRLLADAGFDIPTWIATNDADAVGQFVEKHGPSVYKSCSGMRSRVRLVDDALLERLETGSSPVVVQQRIPGHDVRVHTVADQVFATAIHGDGIDYRFENKSNRYSAVEAPPEIAALCVTAAFEDGLTLAGIDFRVADDGRWYCLEMNPVPTFLPYEVEAEQPIAAAVLDLFGSPKA